LSPPTGPSVTSSLLAMDLLSYVLSMSLTG
jgi:hypothetical protein